MISSLQQYAPGSLATCAPSVLLGLPQADAPHRPGSAKTAMRPASMTSIGGMNTVPPLAVTLATAASALSTLT